jgi:hypothetical protein
MVAKKKVMEKKAEENGEGFAFRVKMGEYEVEVKGKREDVTKTIENLPILISQVHKAFDSVKPKTVATLTVKTEPSSKSTSEEPAQSYPKIVSSANCEEAVIKILETDWGKWRPRTIEELKETMKANGLKFSDHVLDDALHKLGDKGMVRRWNTNTGFVYILGEGKRLTSKEEM